MPERVHEPVHVLGLPFAAPTREAALERVRSAVATRTPLRVVAVNVPKVVALPHDPVLREAFAHADLLLPDGMGIVWASRLLGSPLPERVTGIGLLHALLAAGRGWRVYVLGTTEAVSAAGVEALARRYPHVAFVGRHHGYFPPSETEAVLAAIRSARPDVLLLALETPRKEIFAWRHREALAGVPVVLGVGGALDVIAGARRRAPRALRRAGLEWAWRMGQRPPRHWPGYFADNLAFARILWRERRHPGSYSAGVSGSDAW